MNSNNKRRRPSKNGRRPSPSHGQAGAKPSNGRRSNNRSRRGNRKPSSLDPSMLIKKAVDVAEVPYEPTRTIAELPIDPKIIRCLTKKGFEYPTEIQDRTLEPLLDGRDMLGIAQTGTGKTGAFLIPIIEELQKGAGNPYALVLVPTRELATQVQEEFRSMTDGLRLYSHCFIGGTNINRDIHALRRNAHVVVATPGRLLDLAQRKQINLRKFHTLVLDEFDRMLDMGFEKDVMRIINMMEGRRHSLLFSATLDKTQERLIDEILHDPVMVKVSTGLTSSDSVEQDVVRVGPDDHKFSMLTDLISDPSFEKVLVFEETKRRVARLCKQLNDRGINAVEIHGDKTQAARQTALKRFKTGKASVMVATDVASRGIDVSDVTHVINYEMPQTYDSYIHRIGRTGRAGKKGVALTFVAA